MAKTPIEKQLDKMQRDAKKRAEEERRRAVKQALREQASSIVIGQPIINDLRIMDETAEVLLTYLLELREEIDNDNINFIYDKLPTCIQSNIGLEFEKLTQYGMTSPAQLSLFSGVATLLPPAKSYFNRKSKLSSNTLVNNQENDMIFISHRSTDKPVVDLFVGFLKKVGVPSRNIFYSSLPGNDVKNRISVEIKDNLRRSIINIVILSKDYYQSAYCLNEAGIIWYQDTPTIIIALSEIDDKTMVGFLNSDYILRRLNIESDISSIYDQLKVLYNIDSNVTVVNEEIRTLISEYSKWLNQRQLSETPCIVSKIDSDVTVDEAAVLYYIWRTKKRKIKSIEVMENWLIDNEIYGIDIRNGVDILVADNFGNIEKDALFVLNIQTFRMLIAKDIKEMSVYKDLLKPHIILSKQTFETMWNGSNCIDLLKLLVAYIRDERISTLGNRWRSEAQIQDIKVWEGKEFLDNKLSSNYGSALSYFIENNLVHPSDYTSFGNPREYELNNSLKTFLFGSDFPYDEDLKAIKNKYFTDMPF